MTAETHSAMRDQISVLSVAESFYDSSVAAALQKLGIFERLGPEEKSLDELAAQTGARQETLARLLNASVALNLLASKDGAKYKAIRVNGSNPLPSVGEDYRIAEGFFRSNVILALLKLGIFEQIGEGSRSVKELAVETKARPDALARVLDAGVFLKLLENDGGNYRLAPMCRSVLLPSAGDNYVGDWIRNLDFFRQALAKLADSVQKSGPHMNLSEYLKSDKDGGRDFELAMQNYASLRGKELARHLDTSKCESLLDLGAGPGSYAFNLGMQNPNLKIYLQDMPEVLEVAKEVAKNYPLKNEVHYLPYDAVKGDVPGSYDMVLVSNMLHMIGEQASRGLLKKLYQNVNPGGSVVIQAQFLRDDHMGGRWPAVMDLILLCTTPAGRNHSVAEARQWMEEAGFKNIEYRAMGLANMNSILRGYK
ncbi:MAG: methyltransferase [Candidatus Sulfotelmatobacter sp.]|jgi:ubiquinone/menaquinone biosynthesis C-methylase UbiE